MRTDLITDERSFLALQPDWDAVLSASNQDVPFLRHDWLLQWWRAFGCRELAIVTCSDDGTGELLGVLPAYRCNVGVAWSARTLRLLGEGRCGSSGLGAFARRDAEAPVFERLARTTLDEVGQWDALELRYVRPEAAFAHAVADQLAARGGHATVSVKADLFARPCIDLQDSWDAYLARSLSHAMRQDVRRCMRRAQEAGMTVEAITSEEMLEAALDEAIEIHEIRMRDVVSPQFTITTAQRQFWHAVCRSLLTEDRLRLSFLVADGRRVACECQMRYRETRYTMWGGFLSDWAHVKVSKVLFAASLQDAIAEGCTSLDFGLGEMRYKSKWGATRIERFGMLLAYRTTLPGQLARGRDATVVAAQRAIDSAPEGMRKPLWNLAQGAKGLLRAR